MHVLLIEDDHHVRAALDRILVQAGYTVSAVETGEQGLRAVDVAAPDVVLLDLNLGPGISGFDVAMRLPRGMPLIVVSGMPSSVIAQQANRFTYALASALVVLEKPLNMGILLGTLKRLAFRDAPTLPPPPPTESGEQMVGGPLEAVEDDDPPPPDEEAPDDDTEA